MVDMLCIIYTRPGSIFVIPSAEIIIANTLGDHCAYFGGRAGFIGRFTTILVIGKAWNLIANG